jgi:S1-C subfamily serine protease
LLRCTVGDEGGVDADQIAAQVQQGPAGIAGIEGGNPQRIGQTVTAGIVSGLHRANVGLGA